MLKMSSIRRIIIASFALIIVIVSLYLFPKKELNTLHKNGYKRVLTSSIYLIDKNDYVARTNINVDSKSKEGIAIELINALINGSSKNKYLPDGFKSYIPVETKINKISINGDLIIVDFNEKILNIKTNEEKMIESIVYTLTEIDGINRVQILINGEILTKLPISGKHLPSILDRSIGINKLVKTNSFKHTQDVTTYFINTSASNTYYIPVTIITDDPREKIEIIIKELESKDNIDSNLSTYISAGTVLENYHILENEFNMEFNSLIFNGLNDISEEVIYGLALSIKDNYDINKISIDVNSKQIKSYVLKNP